jgi:hypothetical protein
MPILSTDIKYYESKATGTTNLGGEIDTDNEVSLTLHDLFDKVESIEALDGAIDYRCVYVSNVHSSITLTSALVYISNQTPSIDTSIFIGVGTSIVGGVEQGIADELTPPNGVTFSNVIGVENGLVLGNIPATSHKAIWFKRVTSPAASAYSTDGFTIAVKGDTIA